MPEEFTKTQEASSPNVREDTGPPYAERGHHSDS